MAGINIFSQHDAAGFNYSHCIFLYLIALMRFIPIRIFNN
ncbi:hypothetical protein HMPREF0208_01867 [Citrobacter koseri]|nr:hypothetical protein HMPREF3220_03672 [Citrobacter koseri]KXA00969.1 hypothetical protein HMPREF3207_03162 [Citrobacter koseri]KXB44516.1 hypothetical protein HMPREF0208_01867 [Citrobacter koseri]